MGTTPDNFVATLRADVTLIEGCKGSRMICAAHFKGDHWELQHFGPKGGLKKTSVHATLDVTLDFMRRAGATDLAAMGTFAWRVG